MVTRNANLAAEKRTRKASLHGRRPTRHPQLIEADLRGRTPRRGDVGREHDEEVRGQWGLEGVRADA